MRRVLIAAALASACSDSAGAASMDPVPVWADGWPRIADGTPGRGLESWPVQ